MAAARLLISVKPGSKRPGIEVAAEEIVLRVRERAVEGAANAACIEALSDYLDLPASRITLVRGERARTKLFEIDGLDLRAIRDRLRAHGAR